MNKFKSQFSGPIYSSGHDKDQGVSKTIPDQTLTIKELLDRHSRGVSLGAIDRQGEYFDTEVPKFNDLTEALEYKKNLNKQMTKLNAEIKKQKSEQNAKVKPQTEKPVVADTEADKGVEKNTNK